MDLAAIHSRRIARGKDIYPVFAGLPQPNRVVLEKLFLFEPHEPLPADDSLRIIEAPGRYKKVETIERRNCGLLGGGRETRTRSPSWVPAYRELPAECWKMCSGATAFPICSRPDVPLLRIPFCQVLAGALDLVMSRAFA